MKLLRNGARLRAGFTMLEMAMAVALFSIVIGSAMAIVMDGSDTTRTSQQRAVAASKAQRALDRVITELRISSRDVVTPDPSGSEGASGVQFQQPAAVAGGVVTWSGVLQVLWESAPEDPLGGGDDDGDGLVDEGRLILVRNLGTAQERRIPLVNDVPRFDPDELDNDLDDNGNGVIDETGFNIQRVGDVYTLRLAISEPGRGGERTVGRAQASIRLRN